MGDTNLRSAKGLNETDHFRPSVIDHQTIIKSEDLPRGFLRKCGIPENLIDYYFSLSKNPGQYYSCFISYSHADKPFAQKIYKALQSRGIRCWLDEHQLLPGDNIYTQVSRGIRLWDKVLLCCSRNSLQSWWVDNEIQIAFEKEQRLWKERKVETLALIPLNLDGYLFSDEWQSGKAVQLKSRLAADFTGWETENNKFEEQFDRLLRSLRADAGGREQPPTPNL
jgi:hypothetical protein